MDRDGDANRGEEQDEPEFVSNKPNAKADRRPKDRDRRDLLFDGYALAGFVTCNVFAEEAIVQKPMVKAVGAF